MLGDPPGPLTAKLEQRGRHELPTLRFAHLGLGQADAVAALALIDRYRVGRRRITLGADKGYDVAAFVEDLRARGVNIVDELDETITTPNVMITAHGARSRKSTSSMSALGSWVWTTK